MKVCFFSIKIQIFSTLWNLEQKFTFSIRLGHEYFPVNLTACIWIYIVKSPIHLARIHGSFFRAVTACRKHNIQRVKIKKTQTD